MAAKFDATTLRSTSSAIKGATLALTLASADGRTRTLTVTPDLALALAGVLADYGATAVHPELEATKRPRTYAIGTGRYENVVLLRFEDEAPYALPAQSAVELAKALIDQSQALASRPLATLQ